MSETREEGYVREMFASRFQLDLRKLTEARGPGRKTADFEMLDGVVRSAVVEVKLIERTPRTVENGWKDVTPDGLSTAVHFYERRDNAPSRVCALIHKAYQQLVRYAEPKVLVFVNDERVVDVDDLTEAVTGAMYYESDAIAYINGVTGTKEAHKRIEDEASKIDLYVWIDRHRLRADPIFRFGTTTGLELALRFFGASAEGLGLTF
jgi:hypothetical protein